jgi:Family of unknown function (DUF5681)
MHKATNDEDDDRGSLDSPQVAGTYAVGYGRPPKDSAFQLGRSGNPAGARKHKKYSLQAALKATFEENAVVRTNGKMRNVTSLEALVMSHMARALQRDLRSIRYVVKLAKKVSRFSDRSEIPGVYLLTEPDGEEDLDLLEYRALVAAGKNPDDFVEPRALEMEDKNS